MEACPIHTTHGHVQGVGQAVGWAAVTQQLHPWWQLQPVEPMPQLLPQSLETLAPLLLVLKGQRQCLGQPHNQGGTQAAAAIAPLLATPVELGRQRQSRAHHQSPHTLRSVKLVATQGQQIHAPTRGIQGHVATGLGCVTVVGNPPLTAEGRNGFHVLKNADFIVGGHHAHQHRVGLQRRGQGRQLQTPIRLDRQHRQRESQPLQIAAGLQHSRMFRGHGDQMPSMTQALLTEPFHGQVVGLGGAAGENHLGWGHAKGVRHSLPRLIHCHCRGQTGPMAPLGGVGKRLAPVRRHGLNHRGVTRGGGVVVQIRDGLA